MKIERNNKAQAEAPEKLDRREDEVKNGKVQPVADEEAFHTSGPVLNPPL